MRCGRGLNQASCLPQDSASEAVIAIMSCLYLPSHLDLMNSGVHNVSTVFLVMKSLFEMQDCILNAMLLLHK